MKLNSHVLQEVISSLSGLFTSTILHMFVVWCSNTYTNRCAYKPSVFIPCNERTGGLKVNLIYFQVMVPKAGAVSQYVLRPTPTTPPTHIDPKHQHDSFRWSVVLNSNACVLQ
jgi:hypothetical protein